MESFYLTLVWERPQELFMGNEATKTVAILLRVHLALALTSETLLSIWEKHDFTVLTIKLMNI